MKYILSLVALLSMTGCSAAGGAGNDNHYSRWIGDAPIENPRPRPAPVPAPKPIDNGPQLDVIQGELNAAHGQVHDLLSK